MQWLLSPHGADDALLKIKMLGSANRRRELVSEADNYYERLWTKCHEPISQNRSMPWLLFMALFAAGTTAIAVLYSQNETAAATWITILEAAILSSVVGFAFSAIAGAILFHIDSNYIHTVQTMLVASISMQIYSVLYLRKNLNLSVLVPFLAGGIVTLTLGLYLVTHTKSDVLLVLVGTFLVLYGLYTFSGKVPRLGQAGVAGDVFAGALGGITGPVAAFPGAFVTIWCGLKGWDKTRQRSVIQPYILIMQILFLGALSLMKGSELGINLSIVQYAIPAVAGAVCGLKLFERLNDRQFLSLIAVSLILSGAAMVAKVL